MVARSVEDLGMQPAVALVGRLVYETADWRAKRTADGSVAMKAALKAEKRAV